MARIIPEGWREMLALGAVRREIETLEVLATGLPDNYTVRQPGSAGIDPERIVDAGRRERLVHIIQNILPAGEPVNKQIDRLHRFLGDQFNLVPEVNALVGQAKTLYTRLSGGLSQWARQIECEPFRLRVIGTAGSGKTQLALAVFRDALAAGRRPLYVCYNRPLADHVALIAPSAGEVATYHQLADRICRDAGHPPTLPSPAPSPAWKAFWMTTFPPSAGCSTR